MIRPSHLIKLTTAKLKSKPLMLGLTIGISGLLFTFLFASIIIFSGFMNSSNTYIKTVNDGQYLVRVQPYIPAEYLAVSNTNITASTIKKIRDLENTYKQEQAALYKKQGAIYTFNPEDSILQADPFADSSTPKELRYVINANSPVYAIYLKSLANDYIAIAKNTLPDLKNLVHNSYGTDKIYPMEYGATNTANSVWLQNGKESFDRYGYTWRPNGVGFTPYDLATASARMSSYSINNSKIVTPYLLPENQRRKDNQTAIPVVITQQEAIAMFSDKLHITKRPDDIQSQSKWARNLAESVNGQTYQACYRNVAEQRMIEMYRRDLQDSANNTANPDYVPPSLEYALPDTPCGDITIRKDTRPTAEKLADQATIAMQKKLGTYIEPQHKLLTFVVVGLVPLEPEQNTLDISVKSINQVFGVTRFDGATIPEQLLHKDTAGIDIIRQASVTNDVFAQAGLKSAIVAFHSVDDARRFLTSEACSYTEEHCTKAYIAVPYGTNYLLLDSMKQFVNALFLKISPFVLLLAFIIMLFSMSRLVIESRGETAVFRALGANKGDIAFMYVCYSLIVSVLIAVLSLVCGILLALSCNALVAPVITRYITATQNTLSDLSFSLIDFTSPMLLYTITLIIAIGVFATLLALGLNTRRKIIDDLRD